MELITEEGSSEQVMRDMYMFFEKLEKNRVETQNAWKNIIEGLNYALKNREYKVISDIIHYMDKGSGQLANVYIGEARRVWKICNIIEVEMKKGLPLFCEGCQNYEQLMEKYMLVLYALRRIAIELSEESVNAASIFLRENRVTYAAIVVVLCDELIFVTEDYINKIKKIFRGIWSKDELMSFEDIRKKVL